jgi:hypothetical protein
MEALRAQTASIKMHGGIAATGTVTDPDGKPITGAVVVQGDQPYGVRSIHEVRTDEHGRFRLPPLPPGTLTVTVIARKWMPNLKKVKLSPGMKPVDFQLEPGKLLRIRFVDRSGAPLTALYVRLSRWRGGETLNNDEHSNALDTQIPTRADKTGLYQWTWAPGDAVTYQISKIGYATRTVDLTANGREQTVTLHQILQISGKVTDAATGRPIENVTAIPVRELSPKQLIVDRQSEKAFPGGTYAITCDNADVAYRVRIEAEGYRSAMSDAVRAGAPDPSFDFLLQPAPPVRGRVVNAQGRPLEGARVYLSTPSQGLTIPQDNYEYVELSSNQSALTDGHGAFTFPAQFERYALIAIHAAGYAEMNLGPDGQPGELKLKDWARVEGRLFQAGQPVPSAQVNFEPLRVSLPGVSPQIQDRFGVMTDRAGRFVFPRVPPAKSSVMALLSVWYESPITSSRSVPLDLRPGERVEVDLGGQGASVQGRVVLTGEGAPTMDRLPMSLNRLLRKSSGIDPPAELKPLGFDARGGWKDAWNSTPEGLAYIETLDHYYVKLDRDGRFLISGVPAGDYDLAIKLYGPLKDGKLNPIGSRVVGVRVTENAAREGALDLGDIEVKATPGLAPR